MNNNLKDTKMNTLIKTGFILISVGLLSLNGLKSQTFYPELQEFNDQIAMDLKPDRTELLDSLAQIIYNDWGKDRNTSILFVCTHNSRRSHLAQVWFQVASYYYGLPKFYTYSGGTEATAVSKKAIDALERSGLQFEEKPGLDSNNPMLEAKLGFNIPSVELFSKVYEHEVNPKEDFIAVMVCSEADKSCPIVHGADSRIALPFDDPRYSDNLASEKVTYDKTNKLIASEMFYLVEKVKKWLVYYDESVNK